MGNLQGRLKRLEQINCPAKALNRYKETLTFLDSLPEDDHAEHINTTDISTEDAEKAIQAFWCEWQAHELPPRGTLLSPTYEDQLTLLDAIDESRTSFTA